MSTNKPLAKTSADTFFLTSILRQTLKLPPDWRNDDDEDDNDVIKQM